MSRSRSKEDSQSEFVVEPRVSRSRAVAKVTETAAEDSSTRRRGRTEIKSAIVETQRVTHSSDESAESSSDEDVEMFDASSDLPEFPEVIEPPRTPRRNQAVDVAAALNGLQQRRVVTSAPAPTVLSEMSRGASQGPSSPVVEKSSSTSPIVWIVLLVAAAAVAMWFAPFAQSMLSPTMMAQTPPNIVATPSTPQNIIISSSDAVPNPAGHQSTSESTAASVSASPDQQASKVTETTSTVSPTAPPSVPTQTPSPSPPPISPVQSAIAQLATRHPWFAHSLLSNDSPTSLRFVLEEQLRRISAAMAADADGPRSRAPSDEADSWPRPLVLTIAAPAGARETHAFGEELSRMLASLLQPHRVATPQQAPPRPRMFTLKPGSTSYINANVLRQTILKELNDGKLPGVATSGPPMPSTMWLQASLNSPGFPFSAAHALWSITDEQRPPYSYSAFVLFVDWAALDVAGGAVPMPVPMPNPSQFPEPIDIEALQRAAMHAADLEAIAMSTNTRISRIKHDVGDSIQRAWLKQLDAATAQLSKQGGAAAQKQLTDLRIASEDLVPALRTRLVQHVLYVITTGFTPPQK